MSKKVKMMCPPEILLNKMHIQGADYEGRSPNLEDLDDLTDVPEHWYETAKNVMETGWFNSVSNFIDRPSEILKDVSNGKMVDEILEDYADIINNFYKEDNTAPFESFVKRFYRWDKKKLLFDEKSPFAVYNDELKKLQGIKREYLNEWIQALARPAKDVGLIKNIRTNLLKNSVSGSILNFHQVVQTVLPAVKNELDLINGIQLYIDDLKNGFEELKQMEIGGKTQFDQLKEEKTGFDLFQKPEILNQGIAYFTGKAEGLRKGLGEEEAKNLGIKFNEKTNFIARPGNLPRAYWNPFYKNALALMSYSLQYNKMYYGWIKKTVINRDITAFKSLVKATSILALLYGPESAMGPLWYLMNDDQKREIKENGFMGIKGLYKSFNIDLTDQMRPGSFSVGAVGSKTVENFFDTFAKLNKDFVNLIGEEGLDALANPKLHKDFIKFIRAGLIISPITAKSPVGGGQIGEILEFGYRIFGEDYNRSDWETGKQYETNFEEEATRLLAPSASEKEKAYGIQ